MQIGFILCLGIAVDPKTSTPQMPKKVIKILITKILLCRADIYIST